MTWQQWTMIALLTLEGGVGLYKLYNEPNGQEAFTRVVAIGIGVALPVWALYSAGFWA